MNVITTALDGVRILEPKVFDDPRGYFMETHHADRYKEAGIDCEFVQDNLSYSVKNTLRGLHYQLPRSQAKLVQVLTGEIYDVAVDIRSGSPTFGKWVGVYLSDKNHQQIFVPVGFAHGFCVMSETAHVLYKCSDFYSPPDEKGIIWSDPDIGIDWPSAGPILSDKDGKYPLLADLTSEQLFQDEP